MTTLQQAIARLRSQMEDDASQDDQEIMVRAGDVRTVLAAAPDLLAALRRLASKLEQLMS